MLIENIDKNGLTNVTAENLAIGETHGEILFSFPEENPESAKIAEAEDSPVNEVTVKVDSLDDYLESREINSVDVIKLDVEGAELKALKGMVRTLKSAKQIYIFFEYNYKNFENMNIEPKMIFDILIDAGFKQFYRLWRGKHEISIPQNYAQIKELSKNYPFNILAHK